MLRLSSGMEIFYPDGQRMSKPEGRCLVRMDFEDLTVGSRTINSGRGHTWSARSYTPVAESEDVLRWLTTREVLGLIDLNFDEVALAMSDMTLHYMVDGLGIGMDNTEVRAQVEDRQWWSVTPDDPWLRLALMMHPNP